MLDQSLQQPLMAEEMELPEEPKKPRPPKGAETHDERKELVKDLLPMIADAEAQRDALAPRWDRLQDLADDKAEGLLDKPWDSAVEHHIPVVGPKIDAVVSHVCTPITSRDPYVLARVQGQGSDYADNLEQSIQFVWQIAEFDRHLRNAVRKAGITGKSHIRLVFDAHATGFLPNHDETTTVNAPDNPVSFAGVTFELVPNKRFILYPVTAKGIKAAKIVGHAFALRAQEVLEYQKAGIYFEDWEPHGGEIKDTGTGSELGSHVPRATDHGDREIQLYEILCKLDLDEDGFEERYRIVIDATSQEMCEIERYQYSTPWYFDVFLHEEEGRYWPENSRANRLQGIQIATNAVWSMLDWGSQATAFPTMFGAGWALPEKYARSRPGDVVPLTEGGEVFSPTSKFDSAAFPLLLEDLDKRADVAARISSNGIGANVTYGGRTATEANIRQQGQDVGISDDIAHVGMAVTRMAAFTQELLYHHYELMRDVYGDAFPCQDKRLLAVPARYEVNGKTPENTPGAIAQQAQGLFAMIGQDPSVPPTLKLRILAAIIDGTNLPNKDSIVDDLEAALAQPMGAPVGPDGLQPGGGQGPAGEVLQEQGMEVPQAAYGGGGGQAQQGMPYQVPDLGA